MKRLLLVITATLSVWAAAQSASTTQAPVIRRAPVPQVTAPGQVQPVAPGTKPAPVLPTLTLTPAIPEIREVETISNGFITGAHALILVPGKDITPAHVRTLAREAVLRTRVSRAQ